MVASFRGAYQTVWVRSRHLLSPNRVWWVATVFAAGLLTAETALSVTDPTLQLSSTRTGQSIVVSWVGTPAVLYQVELSHDLALWTNASSIITGTGSQLSFTNSILGQNRGFLRVKRVFPAAPGSASFNPTTGLLTIVCDCLHNVISLANDGTGTILINGGAIPISGGVATATNTVLIQILGSSCDDQISVGNSLPPAHIFGAEGNDILSGGSSNDVIVGGPGRDTISGGRGNDVLFPDGDDTVVWNPGDGNDIIQGSGANNTLIFNGANVNENINLSANGQRLRLTRDVANIVLDADGIETVTIKALGGADNVVVNLLTGTSVTQVNVDLAALGGAGDGAADTVTLNGTAGADTFNIFANAGLVGVTGVLPQIQIAHPEAANDTLIINGLGGTDTFVSDPAVTNLIKLILNQ